MAKEPRPKGYPKLNNYKPSKFMLPTSHYDKKKADRAVTFIENLCHTKGKWAGTPFWLLPWQEQLIRDIFGIVKPDGNRQFRTAFVEICKKVGKSELAAAIALYLLYADNEPSAEVYGAAADPFEFDVNQYKADFANLMATLEFAKNQETEVEIEIEEEPVIEVVKTTKKQPVENKKLTFTSVMKALFTSKQFKYAGSTAAAVVISVVSGVIAANTIGKGGF